MLRQKPTSLAVTLDEARRYGAPKRRNEAFARRDEAVLKQMDKQEAKERKLAKPQRVAQESSFDFSDIPSPTISDTIPGPVPEITLVNALGDSGDSMSAAPSESPAASETTTESLRELRWRVDRMRPQWRLNDAESSSDGSEYMDRVVRVSRRWNRSPGGIRRPRVPLSPLPAVPSRDATPASQESAEPVGSRKVRPRP